MLQRNLTLHLMREDREVVLKRPLVNVAFDHISLFG